MKDKISMWYLNGQDFHCLLKLLCSRWQSESSHIFYIFF